MWVWWRGSPFSWCAGSGSGARVWTLALAAPRAGALAGLAGALAYSALAGFAVSTQRALVMLAVLLAALYWARTPRPLAALTLALALVLAIDPQAVLSYGFWLSFGAVAVLILTLGSRPLAWAGGDVRRRMGPRLGRMPGPGPARGPGSSGGRPSGLWRWDCSRRCSCCLGGCR